MAILSTSLVNVGIFHTSLMNIIKFQRFVTFRTLRKITSLYKMQEFENMYVNNLYLRKIRELFKIKNDSKEKVERYVQKVREEWVEENMIDFYFFGQPDLDYLVRYYLACQAYVNKIMYEKVEVPPIFGRIEILRFLKSEVFDK